MGGRGSRDKIPVRYMRGKVKVEIVREVKAGASLRDYIKKVKRLN